MIETAIKEDLFLDKKLIIPKNKLDAIRIMNELHPVVGGQPTHEKDQPNDNNPILDLACTLANIHASGVGEHADLRSIQNEPPRFFYGEGFISGISSLKGNGILAIFGHWRDGSGNYAIKQFYYTDKEISYRNAVSEDKWGAWIDVLTSNSQLDYNKLLNVPITSTLSDDKNKIASIFSVNEVNRKANTAQTTANNADAKAVAAQRTADTGVANAKVADDKAGAAQSRADAAFTRIKPIAEGGTGATTVAQARTNLGLKGAALVDLTSTLSDAKDLAASIFSVNEVDRKAVTAQATADQKRDNNDFNFISQLDHITLTATTKNGNDIGLHVRDSNPLSQRFSLVTQVGGDRRYLQVPYKNGTLATLGDIPSQPTTPVDQIFIFDGAVVPFGFVERKGQSIDKATMPKLFARYGEKMPDDRNKVHRVYGELTGGVGGSQDDAIQKIEGVIHDAFFGAGRGSRGVFSLENRGVTPYGGQGGNLLSSNISLKLEDSARTAQETRVKSRIVIACNKIQ